jgi:hypothetical protein
VTRICEHYADLSPIGRSQAQQTVTVNNYPTKLSQYPHDVASAFKKMIFEVPGGILGSIGLFRALDDIRVKLVPSPDLPVATRNRIKTRMIALAILTCDQDYRAALICSVFGLLAAIAQETEHAIAAGLKDSHQMMSIEALSVVFAPLLLADEINNAELDESGQCLLEPPESPKRRRMSMFGPNVNAQIDRLRRASAVTQMLIQDWRNVARQLRSISTATPKAVLLVPESQSRKRADSLGELQSSEKPTSHTTRKMLSSSNSEIVVTEPAESPNLAVRISLSKIEAIKAASSNRPSSSLYESTGSTKPTESPIKEVDDTRKTYQPFVTTTSETISAMRAFNITTESPMSLPDVSSQEDKLEISGSGKDEVTLSSIEHTAGAASPNNKLQTGRDERRASLKKVLPIYIPRMGLSASPERNSKSYLKGSPLKRVSLEDESIDHGEFLSRERQESPSRLNSGALAKSSQAQCEEAESNTAHREASGATDCVQLLAEQIPQSANQDCEPPDIANDGKTDHMHRPEFNRNESIDVFSDALSRNSSQVYHDSVQTPILQDDVSDEPSTPNGLSVSTPQKRSNSVASLQVKLSGPMLHFQDGSVSGMAMFSLEQRKQRSGLRDESSPAASSRSSSPQKSTEPFGSPKSPHLFDILTDKHLMRQNSEKRRSIPLGETKSSMNIKRHSLPPGHFNEPFGPSPEHSSKATTFVSEKTPTRAPGAQLKGNTALYGEICRLQKLLDDKADECNRIRKELDSMRKAKDVAILAQNLQEARREIDLWKDRAERAERLLDQQQSCHHTGGNGIKALKSVET